jgi:hypothetical protein
MPNLNRIKFPYTKAGMASYNQAKESLSAGKGLSAQKAKNKITALRKLRNM